VITGDDIQRLEDDAAKVGKKLLIIETQQFFEIEVPQDINTEAFVLTNECKQECANKILSGLTDLTVEDILYWDQTKEEWTNEETK